MKRSLLRRTQEDLERLARAGLDWATFSTEAAEKLRRAIPFESSCWYTVDPSTGLFTGSLNRDMRYAGAWAADYEYLTEDVNKWWFLAHSGRLAGATSLATHGEISRAVPDIAPRRRMGLAMSSASPLWQTGSTGERQGSCVTERAHGLRKRMWAFWLLSRKRSPGRSGVVC